MTEKSGVARTQTLALGEEPARGARGSAALVVALLVELALQLVGPPALLVQARAQVLHARLLGVVLTGEPVDVLLQGGGLGLEPDDVVAVGQQVVSSGQSGVATDVDGQCLPGRLRCVRRSFVIGSLPLVRWPHWSRGALHATS